MFAPGIARSGGRGHPGHFPSFPLLQGGAGAAAGPDAGIASASITDDRSYASCHFSAVISDNYK
jgi:hypothetical protein